MTLPVFLTLGPLAQRLVMTSCTEHAALRRRTTIIASSPDSPPPFFLVRMCKATEGESLGGFDHVQTLMKRLVSMHCMWIPDVR